MKLTQFSMANSRNISLVSVKSDLLNLFKTSTFQDPSEILEKIPALAAKDTDCKTLVDQTFREYLLQLTSTWNVDDLKKYVQYNIDVCRLELSTPNAPVILLSDIFDMSTLEFCESLFNFVEVNVSVWKEDLFFGICKNHLLRMCNDLLRRSSRSQNTVFCGRILLFLAQFFPFSERSGLNIISEFNIENVTDFSNDGDLNLSMDDETETDETETRIKVDFSLYSKFWYLQNFFRCPNDLYTTQKWMMFTSYSKFVLSTLQHYKLEGDSGRAYITHLASENEKERRYFAKFLTSQKLLELQLSDSNFRCYVLVQFLILFQYLTATVKSKPDNCVLKPDQVEWIKMYKEVVSDLIRETPPNGEEFLRTVEQILQREERWNDWKNKSCPEVKKPNPVVDFPNERPKQQHLGNILKDYHNKKKYFMGSPRITRLWNFRPDNLEACRSKERQFLPSLESYFEEAIMQSDPAAMIEPQYKKVKEIDYAWRGLRLLSQKCPYFFAQSNSPIHKMSDFLENMLMKLNKEKPTITGTTEEMKMKEPTENESQESQDVIINTDGAEDGEVVNEEPNINSEPMEEDKDQRTPLTKEQLDRVSEVITTDWQKLGLKMGYQKDEIDFFANERLPDRENGKPTHQENVRYMLQIWSEDDDDPSVENLSSILESLDMFEAVKILKSQ